MYRDLAEKRVFDDQLPEFFQPHMTVLEVGCGSGRWTGWLAERCKHVVALDLSPEMVALAQETVPNENITWHAGTVLELDPDWSFDSVYLSGCLQYMSAELISEMFSWIKTSISTDCQLVTRDTVSMLNTGFHRNERYSNNDPAIYRTVEEYQDLLRPYQWDLSQSWQTYLPPRLGWLMRTLPSAWVRNWEQRELNTVTSRIRQVNFSQGNGDKKHCFFLYRQE
jgi:SAM-dependent methyltransferase